MSRPDRSRQTGDHAGDQNDGELVSVWATAQQAPRTQRAGRYLPATVHHPARMLPALARHAITTYTRPGGLVLDPMCGAGTSLVEAVHTGRHAVGVDIEPEWVRLAAANLDHAAAAGAPGTGRVYRGDARHLADLLPPDTAGRVELVLTSPPYGPSVHGQVTPTPGRVVKYDNRYSPDGTEPANRANLAHHDLTGLLAGFGQILAACRPYLALQAHVVVTVRPWRTHGHLVDLPAACLHAAEAAGYTCTERCVALLAALRGRDLVARPSFFQLLSVRHARAAGIPLQLIAHEDVLVLTTSPAHDPDGTPGRQNNTLPAASTRTRATATEAITTRTGAPRAAGSRGRGRR